MRQVTDTKMRDVKAGIAINVAKVLPKGERVASVKGLLRCDEDEARELIARGRRLEKAKTQANDVIVARALRKKYGVRVA